MVIEVENIAAKIHNSIYLSKKLISVRKKIKVKKSFKVNNNYAYAKINIIWDLGFPILK